MLFTSKFLILIKQTNFCFQNSFPDVFTQFRLTLEKQGIRVRRLINIPDTFKPLPDDILITSIPNLSDFGYSSMIFEFHIYTFNIYCYS